MAMAGLLPASLRGVWWLGNSLLLLHFKAPQSQNVYLSAVKIDWLIDWFFLYGAALCSPADSLRFCCMWFKMSDCSRYRAFWISTEAVYLQHGLVVTCLVSHETAAISVHSVYTMQPWTMRCDITLCKATYVGCMHVSYNRPPALLAKWLGSFIYATTK